MQLQVETKLYKDNAIDNALDKAAREYITYIDESVGVQVHDKATVGSPYHDYVQINSTDISMWRANKKMMSLDNDALEFYYNGDTDNPIARYGEAINLYKIGTQIPVVTINQDGATFEGTINAIDGNLSNSVTIGGKDQSDYLNSNVQIGNLLRLTPRLYEKNEYLGYQLNLTENLIGGETYTLQFWGVSLDDNSEGIELFWGGDVIPLTSEPLLPDENGYLSYTFKVTSVTSNNAWINVYNVPGEHSNKNISITRWKLEKGSVAKAWALAAEDMESTYSCICETAAAEPQKIANCDNFILNVGTVVAVKFINGNNCTSAMKLNIGGTGFKKVLMVGEIEASSSEVYRYNLSNNTTVTFVYDGENWRITGDNQLPAQITHINNGGISIHPVGDINQRLDITADGIDIRKNDKSIAFYGQNARIGEESNYHTSITSNGVSIWSGTEQTQTEGINSVASFGSTVRIGSSGKQRIEITPNNLRFYDTFNKVMLQFAATKKNSSSTTNDAPWLCIGDASATRITLGITDAPYLYMNAGGTQCFSATSSGVQVGSSTNYALINTNGMEVFKGGTTAANSRAQFFDTIRLGSSTGQRITLSSTDLEMYDENNQRRIRVNSGEGVIIGRPDKGRAVITDQGMTIYDNTNADVAFYGRSARIGRSEDYHVGISTDGVYFMKDDDSFGFFDSRANIGGVLYLLSATSPSSAYLQARPDCITLYGENGVAAQLTKSSLTFDIGSNGGYIGLRSSDYSMVIGENVIVEGDAYTQAGQAKVPDVFYDPPANESYGCIVRLWGDGLPHTSHQADTYWIGVGSSGRLYTGTQINGATAIRWREIER